MKDTRLGSILLESGLVSKTDLERCLSIQTLTGGASPIGQILVEQGVVDEADLERMLALQSERVAAQAAQVSEDAMSDSLMQAALANNASEIVVSEGRTVRIRIADRWQDLTSEVVSGPEVWDFAREVVGTHVLEQVAEHNCITRMWAHPEFGQGMARVFRHFEGVAVRLTFAPQCSDNEAIGLPPSVVEAAREQRGLVLVAGERGVGRVEALAALAVAGAEDPATHVVVLDDEPVPLPSVPALVVWRRFGVQPEQRAEAVRTALREDPDVLVIADVGEPATFDVALRAAEDGRLVIAYIAATNVEAALARILDFYAPYDLPRVRASLANVLRAVVVRHPFPHASGQGAVTATELLLPDDVVRGALREGQLEDITLMLRMGASQYGHSLDQSILDLVTVGSIRIEDAYERAEEKARLLARSRVKATQEN